MAAVGDGSDDMGDSLFEGMVLFPTPTETDNLNNNNTSSPPSDDDAPVVVVVQSQPSTPPSSTAAAGVQYQPLDEDLFSDLTLLHTRNQHQPSPPPIAEPSFQNQNQILPLSRQISRKKKRSATVRIGYARDHSDDHPLAPPSPAVNGDFCSTPDSHHTHPKQEQQSPPPPTLEDERAKEELRTNQEAFASVEDKFASLRAQISQKLSGLRERAAAVTAKRKHLQRSRRKIAQDLNLASEKFKELERQLEEACEAEEFERAELVSESLARAEKEKDGLASGLRQAEADCDDVDAKLQEVLQLQIDAEEEGVAILEQFAKDAEENAEIGYRNAEEISVKEVNKWYSLMESLEAKKLEIDLESRIVNEARQGLEESIEHLVEDDRKEKEMLKKKRDILTKELDELLDLVKKKEAEIEENDLQMQEVDGRISSVVSEFHETQSNVVTKYADLQSILSALDSEGELLGRKKEEIDELIFLAEQKRSKLKELASVSSDEVRTCQGLAGLRKALASSALKSREDKVKLAKMEEMISKDINILRQDISASRNSLQELSSTRASMEQEIVSVKQRIGFIDKRGPELEAEKKVAASARNFKEAGRIAAEAKALNLEKESLQEKLENAITELQKLEKKIKDTGEHIQESEGLILSKEKEVATASYKRLRLVASAARADRDAALELGDTEEADILLHEAEAAECRARDLQEQYGIELEDHVNTSEQYVSIAFVTSLAGQRLAEMAASFNVAAPSG